MLKERRAALAETSAALPSHQECSASITPLQQQGLGEAWVEFAWEEIARSIPERFERIVRQYPHRLAVQAGAHAFTYDALNRTANRLAHALLAHRGPGSEPIALLFDQGVESIAAFFGVLKAGKFVVMLAPFFPRDRLTYMLEDSQAGVLVTHQRHMALAETFHSPTRAILNIDDIPPALAVGNPGLSVSANDLAALMYTSGSTGTPKGVMRAHRNFLYPCAVYTNERRVTVHDRVSLVHALSFGSAYSELFPALLNGAALLLFDLKMEGVHRLATWLREAHITLCHLPPVAFRQLAAGLTGPHALPDLRLLYLSGAPITRLDFALYTQHFAPRTLLEIGMSTTEACGVASAIVDQHFLFPPDGTPIGYPHQGRTILVLDEDGREVGPGEVGELAIQGRHLSLGYWRQPALTRAKFVPDPRGGDERLYLTGDLGKRLPDGLFVHLGRKDLLVKIRGYRVELGEVERALATHPQVREAAVVAWDREPGEKMLVAYVVPHPDTALSVAAVQDWLTGTVPDYMRPAAVMLLAALPLTNGKLDRQALSPPEPQRPALGVPYVAPHSALEAQLVALWESLLAITPIGIHDDFFALGGHSLLGAALLAQVHHTCQVDLPLRALFEAPTIAQLATCIDATTAQHAERQSRTRGAAYVFELQAGSERPPVFVFPGGGGGEPEFFIYARLARRVGPEYPFYGLRARGADGVTLPHRDVPTMAADYLADMQRVQPHGPYVLVGECVGGIVAYEVACQLQARGEAVAGLILMDTPRPTQWSYWTYRAERGLEALGKRLLGHSPLGRSLGRQWQRLRHLPYRQWLPYVCTAGAHRVGAVPALGEPTAAARRRAQAVLETAMPQRHLQHITQARACYGWTLRGHRPQPYTGPIQLLVSEAYYRRDPTLGWDTLARGGVHLHQVPGNHETYIREHVEMTAQTLKACLDSALDQTTPPQRGGSE
jgi:amino acid adenylation domain-containing protein